MTKIAEFERQNGRSPTIRELARTMGKRTSEVRNSISKLMGEGEVDGTSACTSSLKEILLGTAFRRLDSFSGQLKRQLVLLHHEVVLLLDESGSQVGVVSYKEARATAKEKGLDLFILNPDTQPPIARLMDYGKHKFDLEKGSRAAKAKHHVIDVKELRLGCNIAARDYKVKLQTAAGFLKDGDRVSLSVLLTDRKVQHVALAFELLNRFAADLEEFSEVGEEPVLDGRTAKMLLLSKH
jgi:translation initiation factor IF-3